MHIGYGLVFQNPDNKLSDREVWRNEIRLAEMVEPMGFDSIWSIEHHFDDYTMCPDPVQFLTYMAGRTKHVKLGSMVVVLPWHDPIRVAEGVSFVEHADMIMNALEKGYMEGGAHTNQPRREIRPFPFKSFKGRTYAAAVSPESMPIMAKLGVGLLVIPQKPWEAVKVDFENYHRVWREVNGTAPAPKPLSGGFVFVDENADRAEAQAMKWLSTNYKTVIKHYEMTSTKFGSQKGYEFYGQVSK